MLHVVLLVLSLSLNKAQGGGCLSSVFIPTVGPRITGCVVDAPRFVFVCSNYARPEGFDLPLPSGTELGCSSPEDVEDYLMAVRRGKALKIPRCYFSGLDKAFSCVSPTGKLSLVPILKVDNYICYSERDRKRIEARCVD